MKLPENFKFGRFKLESYFVLPDKDETCEVVINGIHMTVTDPNHDEYFVTSTETAQRLYDGKTISAYILIDFERIKYSIRIEDDWVYIDKM